MKRIIATFVLILFVMTAFMGCKETTIQSEDFIMVDVTAKYPKKELILQDFLDVEYIPLETNDDFITTAYIRAVGKEIIIIDNRARPFASKGDIFIFHQNGKGLRKINRMGEGGEEYLNIGEIILDEDNDEIFVNSHFITKIFVYDLFGNFKRSFGHKEGTFYYYMQNFDPDHLIGLDGECDFDEIKRNRFLIISKQDGSVIREIEIPYDEKKSTQLILTDTHGNVTFDSGIGNLKLIPYRDSWILVEPSSDTIYKYSPDHNQTPFIVRTPSIQSINTEVYLFPGVLTDQYYFMQAVKKEFDFEETTFPRTHLLYDKKEKSLYECAVYNDDFITKKPVIPGFERNVVTLINNNEIAFMQKLEAFDLVEAYGKGELRGKLKEIVAELEEESNPVIMIAKYRK